MLENACSGPSPSALCVMDRRVCTNVSSLFMWMATGMCAGSFGPFPGCLYCMHTVLMEDWLRGCEDLDEAAYSLVMQLHGLLDGVLA